MKKLIKSFALLAAAAIAFVSCQNELDPVNPDVNSGEVVKGQVHVEFGATSNEPQTKVTLGTNDDIKFEADWITDADKLSIEYIWLKDEDLDEGTVLSDPWNGTKFAATMSAPMEGDVEVAADEWAYTCYYPEPTRSSGELRYFAFGASREQQGPVYNGAYDLMKGGKTTYNSKAGKDGENDIVFNMDRLTSIAYFHITTSGFDASEKLATATLEITEADNTIIASDEVYCASGEIYADGANQSSSITLNTTQSMDDIKLWYNVIPLTFKKATLTLTTDKGKYIVLKMGDGSTEFGYMPGELQKAKIGTIPSSAFTDPTPAPSTDPIYTLAFTQQDNSSPYNSYTAEHTYTCDEVEWKIWGNQAQGDYLRFGGKNTTATDRTITSSDYISGSVKRIVVNHGGYTNGRNTTITFNKFIAEVSGTSDFASIDETVTITPSIEQEAGEFEFEFEEAYDNCFYRITMNYQVQTTSTANNSYISINSIDFYEGQAATKYNVTIDDSIVGGSVTASASTAKEGATITLVPIANVGYDFTSWNVTCGSNPVSVTDNKFIMPAGDVTVSATFTAKPTYTITLNQPLIGGTISASDATAWAGKEITLTATPTADSDYEFNSWSVTCGDDPVTVTDNKFTMPSGNVSVTATFVFNYKLSVTPVNPENVSSEATTKHFTVTTNTSDWEAVVDPAHTWASINNKTATGFDVVLTANELPAESTLDRLVTVYITSEQAGYTGENKITRTFTQAGKTYVDPDSDITFNFTEENPGDWRTTQGDGTYTYTLNDVDYSFTIGNGRYTAPSGTYSGYVMLYSTSTSGSYLSLPTREGKKLTKVVIKSRSGGSTAVAVGISVSPDASVSVTGGTAQTWSSAGSEYTYNLSNTEAEEVYYITNYSEKNAQIESITLSFENEAPKVVDHLALSGTYPTVFYVGDTYNRTGMIVTAFFTDDTNKNVTDLCSFNGFNSASPVASQSITVGYKTSEISYNVTIKALLSITNYASAEGNVTASKNTAKPGETIALIVSPADGKKLTSNSLKVHKTGDENTTVSVVDNSFTMPDYDVTIKAAFEAGSPGFTTKKTVTYTGAAKQSNKWQVNTTGSAPTGSSATYDQSYGTLGQMTSGNWVKYTITGFTGKKITKISLSMKSNTKGGAGWYYFKSGTNTLSSIGSDGSGVAFNQSEWNNAWSTSYVTVIPTMSDATHVVAQGENLEVYIKATANSLYCQSIEIEYYE